MWTHDADSSSAKEVKMKYVVMITAVILVFIVDDFINSHHRAHGRAQKSNALKMQ